MGFGEFLSIEPFWLDLALVQELWNHWNSCSGAFLFPWGHMTPTLEDVTRLTGLRVHGAALSGHSLTDYRHFGGELSRLLSQWRWCSAGGR